jgi:hypothetical protein
MCLKQWGLQKAEISRFSLVRAGIATKKKQIITLFTGYFTCIICQNLLVGAAILLYAG